MSVDEDKAIMNNGLQGYRVLRNPPRTKRVGPRRPQSARKSRTPTRVIRQPQLIGSLGEIGIGIPEQIKIVIYDDNKWLDCLKFPISVITQPSSEIGFTAIDMLVRMMLHPAERRKLVTEVFLETGFIDRL